MNTDKKIERIFKDNKSAVADDGFTDKVLNALPAGEPWAPVLIVAGFFVAEILLTLIVQGPGMFEAWNSLFVETVEGAEWGLEDAFAALSPIAVSALCICYAAASLLLKRI
ncbi:MAG: DUF5056 domain-containing protein [Rikenellaceae bacterium]|nr:DUF5056 domain-containing protein [Rikenellaceae bacterium]